MTLFSRVLLIILLLVLYFPIRAQSYNARQIQLAERLHSLADNAPPELAYIQTSKDIYETGEDLWFKVYLLDAQYLVPSLLSKTLYLQLINENSKKAVWQEKYEIQDGLANGRVYLESNLEEGDYLLAVYTASSFFDDTTEFKAIRRIKVTKDISSLPIAVPLKNKGNSIQFNTFPEGGDLVSGIQSKLAFKAVKSNGEPVEITGTLFEDNSPFVEFKSTHAGMGSIYFTPDNDKRYLIRITEPVTDSVFPLPEIFPEGMAMQLSGRDEDFLYFKVSHSRGLKEEEIYLRVQCRGEVFGLTMGKLKGELKIKVPLDWLPQGIAEVTLFNSNLVPVAERLVYVNRNRKLYITTGLLKEIYPTRGKATLKITVKDENGDPVEANLGVSVFDKLYQNPGDSNNILTHYYLSTQLKGRIYNPSFYLNSESRDRDEAMDLLMLTQGWRKYIWNEMNLKKDGEEQQQVIFDEIIGELYYPGKRKKIPKEQLFVIAYSPNKDSVKVVIIADPEGKFNVSTDQLKEWENDYVYLKPVGPYESQRQKKTWDPLAPPEFIFNIRLTEPFETIKMLLKYKEFTYPLPGLFNENKDTTDLYKVESNVVRIKEVTIKGQKVKTIRGKYLGTLDSLANLNTDGDYVCRYGILNCPNHNSHEYGTTRPRQGFQYPVIYDNNTPGARIRIVTYWRPIYSEEELLKINNLSRVKAYYGKRIFYQPDYDKETDEAIVPDFRNTLLWEPSVITDEKGEATLSFFCSDINTDFVGRIEGVGGEGLLGTGYFKFTVRKMKITH